MTPISMSFYTSLIIIIWISLLCLCVLVRENARIAEGDKWRFYLTSSLIAASSLAEWLGVQLNGNDGYPVWILAAGFALASDYEEISIEQLIRESDI